MDDLTVGGKKFTNTYTNITGAGLTLFLCLCTAVIVFFAIRNTIPQENREFVTLIIGWLTAKLSTVIDWCYGTSSVNRQQSDSIATLAHTNAAAHAAMNPAPDVTLQPGASVKVAADDDNNPTTGATP